MVDIQKISYTNYMKPTQSQISVILPAYNEAEVVSRVIHNIQAALQQQPRMVEIIVIDDGSSDQTAELAEAAGARVIQHPYNIGNGAAIKTGIRNAKGEVIVMLDADGQHSPEDILRLVEPIGKYDMVVGARTRGSQGAWHRNLANWVYNRLASYVSGRRIDDLTSGFRAIKAEVARNFVYLLPNQFSYPTTLTLATIRSGRALKFVPIQAKKRVGKSKIRIFRDGVLFLLIILKIATFYSPLKIFFPVSIVMFLMGFCYGLFKVIFLNTRYGPTSAMLMTISVVVFMVGLVSEQVAQLRFDRSETEDHWD
jgi:glycosyltransferase involved in cell wall biosynthesis